MSATKFTASPTEAKLVRPNRQEQEDRPIGVGPGRRSGGVGRVSSSAHWTSSMNSASGWIPAEARADRDARKIEGPEELGVW